MEGMVEVRARSKSSTILTISQTEVGIDDVRVSEPIQGDSLASDSSEIRELTAET